MAFLLWCASDAFLALLLTHLDLIAVAEASISYLSRNLNLSLPTLTITWHCMASQLTHGALIDHSRPDGYCSKKNIPVVGRESVVFFQVRETSIASHYTSIYVQGTIIVIDINNTKQGKGFLI